jgi:hypothetical protein
MTDEVKQLSAKLGIAGTLLWHDKDGNVVATSEISGTVPLPADEGVEDDDQRSECL